MKMDKEGLSAIAFAAQYSHLTEKGRETSAEAMARVKEMHLTFFKEDVHKYINEAFLEVFDGKVYPSQRSTQFGGKAILNRHWRIYNCTASYCDRPRFFAEYLWLLLCGCGCGVSVQKDHVKKLPNLISKEDLLLRENRIHLIEDSIEGWSNAIHELICSYIPQYASDASLEVHFDYDLIRPKGATISSGGLAPGPDPLKETIEKVRTLLKDLVINGKQALSPLNCFDICAALSEAVLSGGVRRSASIMIFSFDDEEMKTAKVGDWHEKNLNRRTANISAAMIGDKSLEEITNMIQYARDWGEPGQYWIENKEILTNPCAEIGLFPRLMMNQTGGAMDYILPHQMSDITGVSGWQSCNLTEINLAKVKDKDEFFKACRSAAIIGTLQSMYTDEGYLLTASRKIIERERLLGISLTGIYSNVEIGLNPEILKAGVSVIRKTNMELAKILNIDFASRLTCIKPSGNTSVVAGTSAGAHPWHSEKFIRTMRLSLINPVYQFIKSKFPDACKDVIKKDEGIINFAIEAPQGSITRKDLTAIDHLNNVALLQKYWVAPGSNDPFNKTPAVSHSVSCTITVKSEEWNQIAPWLYEHMKNNKGAERIRGVSFLEDIGDLKYEDAPYQRVDESNLERWESLAKLEFNVEDLFSVLGASPDLAQDPACSGGGCLLN